MFNRDKNKNKNKNKETQNVINTTTEEKTNITNSHSEHINRMLVELGDIRENMLSLMKQVYADNKMLNLFQANSPEYYEALARAEATKKDFTIEVRKYQQKRNAIVDYIDKYGDEVSKHYSKPLDVYGQLRLYMMHMEYFH